jgi:hypothetical protein
VQPPHKLSAAERAELLAVANSVEFGHLPPSQIVPRLADQQRYFASESTFYRVLTAEKQLGQQRNPLRWKGPTRNWQRVQVVHLNPAMLSQPAPLNNPEIRSAKQLEFYASRQQLP